MRLRNRPGRIVFLLVLMPLLAAGVLYACRRPILVAIGQFLVLEDRLEKSDLIMLLNGDAATRPFHAAKLLQQGLAPRIAIARAQSSPLVHMGLASNTTDVSVAVLKKVGVAEAQVLELEFSGGVGSTHDEAMALRAFLRRQPANRVIVVSSAIHSRRAMWTFRRVFEGSPVVFLMAPNQDLRYTVHNWWTNEDGFIGCQNEYLKLLYYRLKY